MARRGRVMVLDKDPAQAESVASTARASGHTVVVPADAGEALRLAGTQPLDVALLAHSLGEGLNGIELGQDLRRTRPHIALVLMTTTGDERVAVMALRAGFDDCLVAPFGAGELTATIASGVEAATRRAALEQELSTLRETPAAMTAGPPAEPEAADMLQGASVLAGGVVHGLRGLTAECSRTIAAILRADHAEAQSRIALEFLVRHSRALDLLQRRLEALAPARARRRNIANLNQLAQDLAEALRPVAGNVPVTVRIAPTTPRVQADFERLLQALACVAANALDAVSEAESPRVIIEVQDEGPTASVIVRDSGPGVREIEAERIFQPFHSGLRQGARAGLGLFCARRIAEENGGTLTVGSGKGGVFVLQLPKAAR